MWETILHLAPNNTQLHNIIWVGLYCKKLYYKDWALTYPSRRIATRAAALVAIAIRAAALVALYRHTPYSTMGSQFSSPTSPSPASPAILLSSPRSARWLNSRFPSGDFNTSESKTIVSTPYQGVRQTAEIAEPTVVNESDAGDICLAQQRASLSRVQVDECVF